MMDNNKKTEFLKLVEMAIIVTVIKYPQLPGTYKSVNYMNDALIASESIPHDVSAYKAAIQFVDSVLNLGVKPKWLQEKFKISKEEQ